VRTSSTSWRRCAGPSAEWLRARPKLRKKPVKKSRKAAAGQKEMLMPIDGKNRLKNTPQRSRRRGRGRRRSDSGAYF
jgi:hypothetical protein